MQSSNVAFLRVVVSNVVIGLCSGLENLVVFSTVFTAKKFQSFFSFLVSGIKIARLADDERMLVREGEERASNDAGKEGSWQVAVGF